MKKIGIVLLIIAVSVISVVLYQTQSGYDYSTDIECVNAMADSNKYVDSYVESVVFSYESRDRELLLYNSQDGMCWTAVLNVKKNGDKKLYKMSIAGNQAPLTYEKEWHKISNDLYYIYVQNEKDIENIECGNYEPVGTSIIYTIDNGEQHNCWIYIIDTSESHQSIKGLETQGPF